jgi:hypothetical protein
MSSSIAAEFDNASVVYRGMEMPVLRSSPKYTDMSLNYNSDNNYSNGAP